MTEEKIEFKRISAKASDLDQNGAFKLEIELDGTPTSSWFECFKQPSDLKYPDIYPKNAELAGNTILYYGITQDKLKEKIEWIDKYIQQANKRYSQEVVKRQEMQKKAEEKEKKREATLQRINETLKGI
ncbi:MAG: hypothetical protein NWF00_10970 [Candidatus Bathyarchaeota archaeon]|nr:hypothetical protein [Candidatus Bathyarchaeota archaeon]